VSRPVSITRRWVDVNTWLAAYDNARSDLEYDPPRAAVDLLVEDVGANKRPPLVVDNHGRVIDDHGRVMRSNGHRARPLKLSRSQATAARARASVVGTTKAAAEAGVSVTTLTNAWYRYSIEGLGRGWSPQYAAARAGRHAP
jgi:hypothetical protein